MATLTAAGPAQAAAEAPQSLVYLLSYDIRWRYALVMDVIVSVEVHYLDTFRLFSSDVLFSNVVQLLNQSHHDSRALRQWAMEQFLHFVSSFFCAGLSDTLRIHKSEKSWATAIVFCSFGAAGACWCCAMVRAHAGFKQSPVVLIHICTAGSELVLDRCESFVGGIDAAILSQLKKPKFRP